MNCNFPNLGQIIKFAFDATGVLPRKHGEQDGLTEQEKKRIQKQLERLVDEDGSLQDRYGELIKDLAFITAGTVQNLKVNFAIGDVAMDLHEVYHLVIRSDGTYLSEKENIRWFCRHYAIPRLALSFQKHQLRYNLAAERLDTPDDPDWYLPTVDEGKITWPLAKAMRWIYQVCETNQTQFHYPGKNAKTDCAEQYQNLESAADWLNGKRMPSWPALYWNFSKSFDRLGAASDLRHRREIAVKRRESIIVALFLARLATYVSKAISEAFGPAFLAQLIKQFRQHRTWLALDLEALRNYTISYIEENHAPAAAVDAIWWKCSEQYWAWFAERATTFGNRLEHLLEEHGYAALPEETVSLLVKDYGDYTVRTSLELVEANREFSMPEGFAQALHDGFDLKSNPNVDDVDIDRYAEELASKGLEYYLPWMEPWLRAAIRYRREEYESAFRYVEAAFENAKYCAGEKQYQLVNQFIELAAKTDRWKSFKKGVEWARYLGLSVRWLRDNEPTEDNLRSVFRMMKKVRYGTL
jgi:hypothetical protein